VSSTKSSGSTAVKFASLISETGTPDSSETAPPDVQNPLGGSYWRQLAFYQAAPESASIYPETVEKTAIIWLEPDKRGTFPVSELSVFSASILTL
jgi:hypothetical protein